MIDSPDETTSRASDVADSVSSGGPIQAGPRWWIAHIEEVLTAALLGVMIGSVGLSVFCRYILQMPLSWTEEVVLVCMVWTVFLGASVATKHKEHIVIDFFVSLAPPRLAYAAEILAILVTTGVLVILAWQGTLLLFATQHVTTTALGIPTMYMYAAVPVSACLMLIHNLCHLAAAFQR